MKYSKERMIKALLLAPLPLLCFLALLFILMNREYSLASISVIILIHALVYVAYCILTVPVSFLFSLFFNRYQALNLFTICLSSLAVATPFFLVFGWTHTGHISEAWWKMYSNPFTIFMAVFPGICYWLFLIHLKDKTTKPENVDYTS